MAEDPPSEPHVRTRIEVSQALSRLSRADRLRLEIWAEACFSRQLKVSCSSPQDLLQEALLRTLRLTRGWGVEKDIVAHLKSVMQSIADAWLRSVLRHPLTLQSDLLREGSTYDAYLSHPDHQQHQALKLREELRELLQDLQGRVSGLNDCEVTLEVLRLLCMEQSREEIMAQLQLNARAFHKHAMRIWRQVEQMRRVA